MQNTITLTQSGTNHATQEITPDYTGIYFFCGTILLIAILTLCVIHKISEKWRIDNYKLRLEEIKHASKEYRDLVCLMGEVQKLVKGIKKNDATK